MFKSGDIVKVLIPNVINRGYDYRLNENADIGAFVRVSVMNRQYIGVIVGSGDSGLDETKIKSIIEVCNMGKMSGADIDWVYKMSDWTLMAPGGVLRLILNVPEAFNPPKLEQLYTFNFDTTAKMTDARQSVADAFSSNDNEAMSVNDIVNIAHVSNAVVKTMIKAGVLCPSDAREINDKSFTFNTDNGVFSKKGLDFGSRVLIETLLLEDLSGKVLDVGCGYGPIGIILSSFFTLNIDMIDINKRAIHLAKMNIKENNIKNVSAYESDIYSSIKNKYDYIVTNPPIRAGKEVVYKILFDAKEHLKKGGALYFVINKKQGAKSAIKDLEKVSKIQVLNKKSSFFLLICIFN